MNNITADANQAAKKSTKDFVLEEVIDLHAREQIVTRETLADFTGASWRSSMRRCARWSTNSAWRACSGVSMSPWLSIQRPGWYRSLCCLTAR